jgi:protein-tyrosine phosphatase
MQEAAEYWRANDQAVPGDYQGKFRSIADFCSEHKVDSVPDPYYGGSKGFDNVLDLLDDACTGLLQHIQNKHNAALA